MKLIWARENVINLVKIEHLLLCTGRMNYSLFFPQAGFFRRKKLEELKAEKRKTQVEQSRDDM